MRLVMNGCMYRYLPASSGWPRLQVHSPTRDGNGCMHLWFGLLALAALLHVPWLRHVVSCAPDCLKR